MYVLSAAPSLSACRLRRLAALLLRLSLGSSSPMGESSPLFFGASSDFCVAAAPLTARPRLRSAPVPLLGPL